MLTLWNDLGFGNLMRSRSPFEELRREMDRLFSDFDRGLGVQRTNDERNWPRVDVYDTGAALVVRAEIPGVHQKNLEISLDQQMLNIKGHREESVPAEYSVHRKERGSIQFSRAFTLPCQVDAEKTTATLKDGILNLEMPKLPDEQPRQIQIRAH